MSIDLKTGLRGEFCQKNFSLSYFKLTFWQGLFQKRMLNPGRCCPSPCVKVDILSFGKREPRCSPQELLFKNLILGFCSPGTHDIWNNFHYEEFFMAFFLPACLSETTLWSRDFWDKMYWARLLFPRSWIHIQLFIP